MVRAAMERSRSRKLTADDLLPSHRVVVMATRSELLDESRQLVFFIRFGVVLLYYIIKINKQCYEESLCCCCFFTLVLLQLLHAALLDTVIYSINGNVSGSTYILIRW